MFQTGKIWNPNLTLLGESIARFVFFFGFNIITNVRCHEHQLQQASKHERSMLNLERQNMMNQCFFSLFYGTNCEHVARFWSFLAVWLATYPFFSDSECQGFNGVPWLTLHYLDRWRSQKRRLSYPKKMSCCWPHDLEFDNTFHQTWTILPGQN